MNSAIVTGSKRPRDEGARPILPDSMKQLYGSFEPPLYSTIQNLPSRIAAIRSLIDSLASSSSSYIKCAPTRSPSSRFLLSWFQDEYGLQGSLPSIIAQFTAERKRFLDPSASPFVAPPLVASPLIASPSEEKIRKSKEVARVVGGAKSPDTIIVVSDDEGDLSVILENSSPPKASPKRPSPVYPEECPICFLEWTDCTTFYRFQCKCKAQSICLACISNIAGLNGHAGAPNTGHCPFCRMDVRGTQTISVGVKRAQGGGGLPLKPNLGAFLVPRAPSHVPKYSSAIPTSFVQIAPPRWHPYPPGRR